MSESNVRAVINPGVMELCGVLGIAVGEPLEVIARASDVRRDVAAAPMERAGVRPVKVEWSELEMLGGLGDAPAA